MKNILVVDDSLTERELIKKTLQEEGYGIETADNGEDALKMVKDNDYDLIILDVVMPGKNGFQVCREIKKDEFTSDIPIILVTSKGQESDKFWGKRQGADEYIVKPFQIEELIATVKRLLK
jgi:twitching motility two-component system response regulator PilH